MECEEPMISRKLGKSQAKSQRTVGRAHNTQAAELAELRKRLRLYEYPDEAVGDLLLTERGVASYDARVTERRKRMAEMGWVSPEEAVRAAYAVRGGRYNEALTILMGGKS